MDWGYESDEIDPEMILSVPVQVEQGEVESQASNEIDLIISDDEIVNGNPFYVGKTYITGGLEEGSQRRFTYGDLLWDASWEDDMYLYDDIDDWCWERDELSGEDSEESMNDSEDSSSNSGDASRETLPYDGESMGNYF